MRCIRQIRWNNIAARDTYVEYLQSARRDIARTYKKHKYTPEGIIDSDSKHQMLEIEKEIHLHTMHDWDDNTYNKIVNNSEMAPTQLSMEEAEQAGLRDINDDMKEYSVAIQTLPERAVDVRSLFYSLGCPEPIEVLRNLISLYKDSKIKLTDDHVSEILNAHNKEMLSYSDDDDSLKDVYVKTAFDIKDLCNDNSVPFEISATTMLLTTCSIASDLEKACKVFEQVVVRASEQHYLLLMKAANSTKANEPEFALELFKEMSDRNIKQSSESIKEAVVANVTLGKFDEALTLRDSQLDAGIDATTTLDLALLRVLSKKGDYQRAISFVDSKLKMSEDLAEISNLLVISCANGKNIPLAMELLQQKYIKTKMKIDPSTVYSLIDNCPADLGIDFAIAVVKLCFSLGTEATDDVLERTAQWITTVQNPTPKELKRMYDFIKTNQLQPSTRTCLSPLIEVAASIFEIDIALQWIHETPTDQLTDSSLLSVLFCLPKIIKNPPPSSKDLLRNTIMCHRSMTKLKYDVLTLYAVLECLLSSLDVAAAGRYLKLIPDLEDTMKQILPFCVKSGRPELATGKDWVNNLSGLSRVGIVSDIQLLRDNPSGVLEACGQQVLVPGYLLYAEAIAEQPALDVIMALPHVNVIRTSEQLLSHAAVNFIKPDVKLDFRFKSHRVLAMASFLSEISKEIGCEVVVVARAGGSQQEIADQLGVKVLRVSTTETLTSSSTAVKE